MWTLTKHRRKGIVSLQKGCLPLFVSLSLHFVLSVCFAFERFEQSFLLSHLPVWTSRALPDIWYPDPEAACLRAPSPFWAKLRAELLEVNVVVGRMSLPTLSRFFAVFTSSPNSSPNRNSPGAVFSAESLAFLFKVWIIRLGWNINLLHQPVVISCYCRLLANRG